jgi:hypothetical protein
MRYTFKSEVIYEAENDELGVMADVRTSSNIMWKYKVVVHDIGSRYRRVRDRRH